MTPLLTLFLIVLSTHSAIAFFRLAPTVLVQERADPIISPDLVSAHVHTVVGGYNFGTNLTYEQLQASPCTSGSVIEDKSSYWTPMVYFWHKNGSFIALNSENQGQQVYYGYSLKTTQAFPKGFRMVAGNPMARTYVPLANNPKKRNVKWECLRYDDHVPNLEDLYNFPTTKCRDGARANIFFPTCWDGRLDSEDHTSHMAYENEDGSCPDTHKAGKFPELHYELYWSNYDIDWSLGMIPEQPFVLSHGDPTGYGFHGDFFNGWDDGVLQRALDDCDGADGANKSSGEAKTCKHFTLQDKDASDKCTKKFLSSPDVGNGETITGWLPKLLGCNPITFTADDAKQAMLKHNCKVGSGADGWKIRKEDKDMMLAGGPAASRKRGGGVARL